jgi:hypothetical protein
LKLVRSPFRNVGRSSGRCFWWPHHSAFSYSKAAESSIALNSSSRTQDDCVIFSIDGSDHPFDGGIERSLASKDSQHGTCLSPQRTGCRSWSHVFDSRRSLGRPEEIGDQTPSVRCSIKAKEPCDRFAHAEVAFGMISRRHLLKDTFGLEMNLMP